MLNRSQATMVLGLILVAVGTAVALAVRTLSFARYMHLEDLGLDVDPAVGPELFRQLVAPTAADRIFFYLAAALIPVGLVLLFLGWRRRGPAGL